MELCSQTPMTHSTPFCHGGTTAGKYWSTILTISFTAAIAPIPSKSHDKLIYVTHIILKPESPHTRVLEMGGTSW